jgi:hypothetical protein
MTIAKHAVFCLFASQSVNLAPGPQTKGVFMIEVVWEGNVCEDCAFMMANGECPDCSHEREEEVAEATAGMVLATSDDFEPFFSGRACDACHSRLGGDRYPAAMLGKRRS